jgi:ankyrin repeat protein
MLETMLSCNSFFYSLHDAIAAVNAPDSRGLTPLHCAVQRANIEAASLLLQHHASPNAIVLRDDNSSSITIPNTTYSNKHSSSSSSPESSPENINSIHSSSSIVPQLWTPLHLAAWMGSPSMLELLVAAGAALEAPDQAGNRPLHVAVSAGHAGALGVRV